MGWWNTTDTTTERDRVTWCSYYIFTSETNLYFWSVLHRELLGNISKYRLKTYTLTNPLNIKHPSNKIIKAFDNSRNSKNILKCFDDKKKSSITRTRIVVELKKKNIVFKNDSNDNILLTCFMQQLNKKTPSVYWKRHESKRESRRID